MRRVLAILAGLALTTQPGCMPWRGPDDIARVIERGTGERYDRETGLTLGRLSLAVARWASDDEDAMLQGLRKLEVGVYRPTRDSGAPATLSARSFPGWTPIAEVRTEPSERLLILADSPDPTIRGLLIVVVEEDELTVVRLRGRLDAILEQAVRQAFDEVDRSDLTEPAIAAIDREEAGP